MNPSYRQWRRWKSEQGSREGLAELDQFDPFTAFADLIPHPQETDEHPSAARVLQRWSEKQGFEIGPGAVIGRGVRDLLGSVWSSLRERVETAWLPGDVYPVYQEIVKGVPLTHFSVNPELDLDYLEKSGPSDLALIPAPLHPCGRHLNDSEIAGLHRWLDKGAGRWLLIDTVYDYGDERSAPLAPLVETGRCILLRSMSKAWLCRQHFGVVEVPEDLIRPIASRASRPRLHELKTCLLALEQDVLKSQTKRIDRAWKSVSQITTAHLPEWRPPSSGYLGLLPGSWEEWRALGIGVVPASVFGSDKGELSVASCLAFVDPSDGGEDKT